jgi:uncharacterized protein
MNRLKDATSPYLLQHADNPVDWFPWGDEAFAEARRRDVPVLLSIGYSACHWCHVMAHESFEDPDTAALVNENLVAIKVDREERPDIDAIYMSATQAITGQGGWPMTVFLTQGREPFFCGTYFPREYFQRLVLGVAKAWREEREKVTGQGEQIAQALAEHGSIPAGLVPGPGDGGSGQERLEQALAAGVAGLAGDFDEVHAGFGGAPKFPPSMVLEFLLRHHERTQQGSGSRALEMAERTADAMARGGMYDQLGGGFARYSVDAGWVVPHFEKMLYDNALLARFYGHLWRRTGSGLARRVAEETCDFMIRELRTGDGGFASALDADSEGEEGKFYVWTQGQLAGVLGPADGEYAASVLGVTGDGTFEGGSSVLRLPADPQDAERFRRVRGALFDARGSRVRPGRDDKVVAAWNGLAIAALAECGLLLGRPDLVRAAEDAASLLDSVHIAGRSASAAAREAGTAGAGPGAGPGLRLARTSRDGMAGANDGVLDDYACAAEGLLALSAVTGQGRWVQRAGELLETVLTRFSDPAGGFYDTADDAEQLLYRPREIADGPSPAGWSAAAGALLSYGALTGSARHRDAATSALSALVPPLAQRFPRAAGWAMAVAEACASGPVEIAVIGPPGDPQTVTLHRTALQAAPPGAVLAVGAPEPAVPEGAAIPLLEGRGLVDGSPAAYVCRGFTCRAPVTEPDELRAALTA